METPPPTLQTLKETIRILKLKPRQRTQSLLQFLVKATSHIDFFRQITEREKTSAVHHQCCKVMTYSEFKQDEFVFHMGDKGDSMYLILQGEVQILIPENEQLSQSQLQDYLLPPQSNPLRSLSISAGSNFLSVPRAMSTFIPLQASRTLSQNDQSILLKIQELVKNYPPGYNLVTVLKRGDHFGDMALMNDKPRNASIRCISDCSFAVLQNTHYQLVSSVNLKHFKDRIQFLKSLAPFQSWSNLSLQKLCLSLKIEIFNRGKFIYKEGDQVDYVYIIRKGLVQIKKEYKLDLRKIQQPSRYQTKGELLKNKAFKNRNLRIVVKQQGELVGFQEIYSEKEQREFSCQCISLRVEVLKLSVNEYIKKVTNPDTKKMIEKNTKLMNQWNFERIQKLKEIQLFKQSQSFTLKSKCQFSPKPQDRTQILNKKVEIKVQQKKNFPAILGSLFVPRSLSKQKQMARTARKQYRTNSVSPNLQENYFFRTELTEVSRLNTQTESPDGKRQQVNLPKIKSQINICINSVFQLEENSFNLTF